MLLQEAVERIRAPVRLCWAGGSLALGFAADAVIPDAETELWRFDILEALDIAFAGDEITSHDMQDAERGGLVDSAEVGFGWVGPGDLLPHRYWPLL